MQEKYLSNKIIIFDFDKTLTIKDSFNLFIKFSLGNYYFFSIPLIIILKIFVKIGLIKLYHFKLFFLKISFSVLKRDKNFISKKISNHLKFNNTVLRIFKNEIKINRCIVISASPTFYIKHLLDKVEIYGLEFNTNPFQILSHPYKKNKIKVLNDLDIEAVDTLYTDSFDDQPLMKISKNVFLVKSSKIKKIK